MGHYLSLRKWDVDVALHEIYFTMVSYWIQIHNLPLEMITKQNVEKTRKVLGGVVKVEDPSCSGGMMRHFLCVCMLIDTKKALVAGFWVPRSGKGKKKESRKVGVEGRDVGVLHDKGVEGKLDEGFHKMGESFERIVVRNSFPLGGAYGGVVGGKGSSMVMIDYVVSSDKSSSEKGNRLVVSSAICGKGVDNVSGFGDGAVVGNDMVMNKGLVVRDDGNVQVSVEEVIGSGIISVGRVDYYSKVCVKEVNSNIVVENIDVIGEKLVEEIRRLYIKRDLGCMVDWINIESAKKLKV
ncbi:hypothetical protein PTKIN_Ptkin10aG0053300 [Pterospermum kingtungense]